MEGRVEVFVGGNWGEVCDDRWDLENAGVVCGELGLGDGVAYFGNAHFGENSELNILLDNVECQGNEETLLDCPAAAVGDHDCGDTEAVGVRCSSEGKIVVSYQH